MSNGRTSERQVSFTAAFKFNNMSKEAQQGVLQVERITMHIVVGAGCRWAVPRSTAHLRLNELNIYPTT